MCGFLFVWFFVLVISEPTNVSFGHRKAELSENTKNEPLWKKNKKGINVERNADSLLSGFFHFPFLSFCRGVFCAGRGE